MKKIITLGVFAFAFAFSMNVAFASSCNCGYQTSCFCPETTVVNLNAGSATTNAKANSYTGGNSANQIWGAGNINAGAASATILGVSQANYNEIDVTTGSLGKLTVFNLNLGKAVTNATAAAGTGNNGVGCAGSSSITTNAATTYVNATSVVNSNTIKINRCCALGCGSVCN